MKNEVISGKKLTEKSTLRKEKGLKEYKMREN